MVSRHRLIGAGFALAALAVSAAAQAYPDKPIDYIIPFAPGGESDITARFQQPFFKEFFGQDLVISYKPGGGGAVAWSQLNASAGDGYTWMGINLPHIILQPAEKEVGYKTEDLAAVYMFHYTPDALLVEADSEFKTLEDFVSYAKENPGRATISGSGKGSANHLVQVTFDNAAGIKTTYVAFKGTSDATTALLGKQVTAEWGYTTVAAGQGDRVRMLAVAMEERHPAFPDVPTFKELGYDIVSGAYRGIAVPQSTPEELRRQISDMIGRINADPAFRKQMVDAGYALLDVDYEDMPRFLELKEEEYIKAAKDGGILQ